MVLAVPIGFADFVLTLGDGATPTEVFTAPCAFNSRALNFTKNLNEIVIPDCSDEDKPGWIVRDPLSITWDIAGEGLLDEGSIDTWDEWFLQTAPKNIKISIRKADLTNYLYTGQAHLQSFNRTANRGEELMWNCAIAGSGALTRTPTPVVRGASFMDRAEDTAAYMEMRAARKERHAGTAPSEAKSAKGKAKEKESA